MKEIEKIESAETETAGRLLRWGHVEGGLSAFYANICGGLFVVGMAVALGASEFIVGIIGAAPFFAMMAASVGSYMVERGISRRAVSRGTLLAARVIWIPFVAVYPIFFGQSAGWGIASLVIISIISSLLGAVGQVTWLGWMSEVVPVSERGRYFGVRNAIVGLVTTLILFAGGRLVEWNFGLGAKSDLTGYLILFVIGALAGIAGVVVLGKIPGGGPEKHESRGSKPSFSEAVTLPMQDPNFRRYLIFQFVWMFGVYMGAPFFAVLLLRDLHSGMGFVAFAHAIGGLANVITYRGWGVLADRYGNKPIMMLCTIFSAAFPLWWFLVTPENYKPIMIALYFFAGASWAGYTLASNNLLLRLSPATHNSVYLSLFTTLTGLATALGPITGGALGMLFKWLGLGKLVYPLLGVFLVASIIRYFSIGMLAKVREPSEAPVLEVLKELGSPRGINTLLSGDAIRELFFVPTVKRENKD